MLEAKQNIAALKHLQNPSDKNCSTIVSYLTVTVILQGRAGYELIYITNEAVGRVGYYQLISGKSQKNNCFSKFSSNSLDFSGETSPNRRYRYRYRYRFIKNSYSSL